METFNKKDFLQYMEDHPELRFWQALYAYLEAGSIRVGDVDPFYWPDGDEKKERYMPELGQAMFGNPTGWFEIPPFAEALILSFLDEIDRVFWNVNQKEWDRHEDPKIKGLVFRPYYWGGNEEEEEKPNLVFDFSPQEIRWYKHPGRGMSCTNAYSNQEWIDWYDKGMSIIRGADNDTLDL